MKKTNKIASIIATLLAFVIMLSACGAETSEEPITLAIPEYSYTPVISEYPEETESLEYEYTTEESDVDEEPEAYEFAQVSNEAEAEQRIEELLIMCGTALTKLEEGTTTKEEFLKEYKAYSNIYIELAELVISYPQNAKVVIAFSVVLEHDINSTYNTKRDEYLESIDGSTLAGLQERNAFLSEFNETSKLMLNALERVNDAMQSSGKN